MAKNRRRARSKVALVLERKRSLRPVEAMVEDRAVAAGAAEPTGSCRYADAFGQIQCDSDVSKSYCDGKGGFFTQDGRC